MEDSAEEVPQDPDFFCRRVAIGLQVSQHFFLNAPYFSRNCCGGIVASSLMSNEFDQPGPSAIWKVLAYLLSVMVAIAVVSMAAFFLYSSVLSKRSLQGFNLTEVNTGAHPSLGIDGRLLGGILAIKSAKSYQKKHCIVLVVRAGITRPGLRGVRFHYDIPVPDDVDKVSFGNLNDVVWTRTH